LHLSKTHGALGSDAVQAADPDRLHIELGGAGGNWINSLAQAFPGRTFYGLD